MLIVLQHSLNKIISRIPREILEHGWSLFVALLVSLLLLFMSSCGNKNEYEKPSVKPLMEAVYSSGFVRAQQEYEVFSEGEGYVVDKLVEDGDLVKKGDVLYILNATQPDARYQMARQNYELAAKNRDKNSAVLSELKTLVQSAESKKRFDSINYERYKNLLNQNVGTRMEFDRIKLAYENSTNEFQLYKNRYQRSWNELQTQYENAKQQLIIAGDDSGRNVVKSLVDGRVFLTKKEKGEVVRRGEPLAMIGNTSSFYIELSIDELDITKLQLKQLVLVKVDAFPREIFHARVSKIYPLIDTRQQSLRVDAILTDTIPGAFSGLALEANIVIQQKDKALTIPKSALLPGDSVWINKDGSKRKIAIKKGIETMDEVEILEGLDSTTQVLLNH